MNRLYIGTSYFFNEVKVHDPNVVCIDDSYDDVYHYMAKVRRLPIIDRLDDEAAEQLPPGSGACGIITQLSFASSEQLQNFLMADERQPFIMVEYGAIDRRITNLKKKEAKSIKVPRIVDEIIVEDVDRFISELKVAAHTLKELLYYMNGYDKTAFKIPGVSRDIITILEYIKRIEDKDGKPLENEIQQRHQLLFCGEHEYRDIIRRHVHTQELMSEYRRHVAED